MAIAVSPETSPNVIPLYSALQSCCEGRDNIYTSRSDCSFVACFTNDRAIVDGWKNCSASKTSGLDYYASKIDYKFLQQRTEQRVKKNSSAMAAKPILSTLLLVWGMASVAVSAF